MNKSKVYYCDMRALPGSNLLDKLRKLIIAAGMNTIDFNEKFAAIKIHFGEPGNLAFLRPNFAKVVADDIKEQGGTPFLTDCNTLYVGRRKNAIDHLNAAYENGYSPFSTGCQIIIADGLKGNDDIAVPIEGGTYIKEAKIGRAIMDADIIISLNHFKGHELTGFGGAIKNLGMGCGSRAGKMDQHNGGKPVVDPSVCRGCRICGRNCAHGAISFDQNNKASIDHNFCVGCGRCLGACNFNAIYNPNSTAVDELGMRMAEYAKAVVTGRPQFHINIVMDVSPYCDCHGESDVPIVPDVGMFASFDPVALDRACVDACNEQSVNKGSLLDDVMHHSEFHDQHDHFLNVTHGSDWRACLKHAEDIGIGTQSYELIKVK